MDGCCWLRACACQIQFRQCLRSHTDGSWSHAVLLLLPFRFFSPLGMAPVVALLGFGLFERGFPVVRAVHLTPHIFDTQAEHTMQYIFFQTGKIVHCIALLFDFTVRLGDALRLDFQC